MVASGTAVTVTRFVQAGKPPVVVDTIENGGYVIPNSRKKALFILGKTTHDIAAVEVIWAFFARYDGGRSGIYGR